MKLKYLGDLEKLHAEFMAAKQQHWQLFKGNIFNLNLIFYNIVKSRQHILIL